MPRGSNGCKTSNDASRERVHDGRTAQRSVRERGAGALKIAEQLHAVSPDWLTFFREILGVDGVVRRLFPTADALRRFEQTAHYARIVELLVHLQSQARIAPEAREPERMITVRLPASIHQYLISEAADRGISMNRLCIAKLMQAIDQIGYPAKAPRPEPSAE
ncbi:MAG: hypothetical protein FJ297_05855 [Planctomycetes bacterium]|nr:hypothetical protein [Planctomycetota bacterium]